MALQLVHSRQKTKLEKYESPLNCKLFALDGSIFFSETKVTKTQNFFIKAKKVSSNFFIFGIKKNVQKDPVPF